MRKLTLTGRIVADAEIKTTKNGNKYIEFRLANNEYAFGGGDNNRETYWFRVQSFNQNHLRIQPYLTKGKPIEVVGDLYVTPYLNPTSNKIDPGLDVRANDIMFDSNFGNSDRQQNTDNTAAAQTATTQTATTAKPTAPRNPTTATVKPAAKTQTVTAAPQAETANVDDGDDLPF